MGWLYILPWVSTVARGFFYDSKTLGVQLAVIFGVSLWSVETLASEPGDTCQP
jgi:hypothetical protein